MAWYTIFPKILNMSLVSGFLILLILLARLLLRKSPKIYSYLLWSAVLFRLLCPVSLPSPMSLVTVARPVEAEKLEISATLSYHPTEEPDFYQMVQYDPDSGNYTAYEYNPAQGIPVYTTGQHTNRTAIAVITILWTAGITGMFIYGILSAVRLKRKLVGAVPYAKNTLQSDYISVPFAAGFFRPKIYIPSSMSERELPYVLLHEQYHIRHLDHIMKYLAYTALCIHWFNPLVWLAFILAEKDMEMRCDEGVLKQLGEEAKQNYSAALLHFSAGRTRKVFVSPSFSEGNIRTRIRNVLDFQKPSRIKTFLSLLLTAVILAGCAITPKTEVFTEAASETIPGDKVIMAHLTEYPIENMTDHSVYVSGNCLYMNPLSSTFSGGDTGLRYIVTENSFSVDNRDGTTTVLSDSITWEWEEFPWTMEEWNDLFFARVQSIDYSRLFDEMLYKKINNRYSLLRMDGTVWLVDLRSNNAMGDYIWSIHTLKPESACGIALWVYEPYYSSRYPAFTFSVFPEAAEVSVYCGNGGTLIDRSDGKDTATQYLQFTGDSLLYWVPWRGETLYEERGRLNITVSYEDYTTTGTVYIQSIGDNIYTATVVGSGLRMEQSEVFQGGVIVFENPLPKAVSEG